MKVGDQKVENVKEFVYLGSLSKWDNDCTKEIKRRIAKAKGVMVGFDNIWKSKQISHKTKLSILKTCVVSTACIPARRGRYKEDRQRYDFGVGNVGYCYRRLLQITWTQEKAKDQNRFNASSDEKEVGINRTCTIMYMYAE